MMTKWMICLVEMVLGMEMIFDQIVNVANDQVCYDAFPLSTENIKG